MTPTRRELLRRIVELVEVTQDLVRATEESTRASKRLREDIARLSRRSPKTRRLTRPRGSRRVADLAAHRADQFRLVEAILVERDREDSQVGRRAVRETPHRSTVAANPSPPPE